MYKNTPRRFHIFILLSCSLGWLTWLFELWREVGGAGPGLGGVLGGAGRRVVRLLRLAPRSRRPGAGMVVRLQINIQSQLPDFPLRKNKSKNMFQLCSIEVCNVSVVQVRPSPLPPTWKWRCLLSAELFWRRAVPRSPHCLFAPGTWRCG